MPTFPNGYHHSEDLPHKQLAGLAFLPPSLRVKVAITRAGHTHIDAAWEDVPEDVPGAAGVVRSEEHTSELQSPYDLVCRLLLEKKKKKVGRVGDGPTRYRPYNEA